MTVLFKKYLMTEFFDYKVNVEFYKSVDLTNIFLSNDYSEALV